MNAQIRLAERQGLLTGHGLSMVQVSAIYLRELQDMHDRQESQTLTLKAALLSTGHVAFADLFPEELGDEAAAEALLQENEFGETDGVTYKFTDDTLTAEEAEHWLAMLADQEDFIVPGDEVAGFAGRIPIDWGDER